MDEGRKNRIWEIYGQDGSMKLRQVNIKHVNNTSIVENVSVTGGDAIANASRAAFRAGAEEMANMVREKVEANDISGLVELLAATKTKSFYGT